MKKLTRWQKLHYQQKQRYREVSQNISTIHTCATFPPHQMVTNKSPKTSTRWKQQGRAQENILSRHIKISILDFFHLALFRYIPFIKYICVIHTMSCQDWQLLKKISIGSTLMRLFPKRSIWVQSKFSLKYNNNSFKKVSKQNINVLEQTIRTRHYSKLNDCHNKISIIAHSSMGKMCHHGQNLRWVNQLVYIRIENLSTLGKRIS